jgi:hypothetical protein
MLRTVTCHISRMYKKSVPFPARGAYVFTFPEKDSHPKAVNCMISAGTAEGLASLDAALDAAHGHVGRDALEATLCVDLAAEVSGPSGLLVRLSGIPYGGEGLPPPPLTLGSEVELGPLLAGMRNTQPGM